MTALAGRELWLAVVARRKAWAATEPDGMHTWPASDRAAWLGRLEDALTTVEETVEGPLPGDGEDTPTPDPLAALVDVLAVAAAWAEAMGEPPDGARAT